jgi:hypothetical protein
LKFTPIALAAALVLTARVGASAQAITSSSDPLLTGAAVVDFESGPSGIFTNGTYNTVTFSTPNQGEDFVVNGAFAGQYNSRGQLSLQNEGGNFGTLFIQFANPTSAFGFNFGASDEQWVLSSYDSGNNLLGAVNAPITFSSNAGDFIGFNSTGNGIAYATLTGPIDDYIFVDDLKFQSGPAVSATPEPASIALLATGLVVAGGVARRRRKS